MGKFLLRHVIWKRYYVTGQVMRLTNAVEMLLKSALHGVTYQLTASGHWYTQYEVTFVEKLFLDTLFFGRFL